MSRWLIRTKNNHLLGPVSKEKMCKLYLDGHVKPDDEICSGNGYWFFVRETELINKYLLGNIKQACDPYTLIKQDPQTLITSIETSGEPNSQEEDKEEALQTTEDGLVLPSEEDLAYPDMESELEEIHLEVEEDNQAESREIEKQMRRKTDEPTQEFPMPSRNKKQNNWMLFVGVILIVLSALFFLFGDQLINKYMISKVSNLVFPSAMAQEVDGMPILKKKI